MSLPRLNTPDETQNLVIQDNIIPMNDAPYTDPVISYFGEIVSGSQAKIISRCKTVFFGTLKGVAVIVGTLSGVPYIAPAMKFAGENKIGGYILAYGVSASLAMVTTWALLDIVDSFQQNKDADHLLPKKSRSCIRETIYWTVVPSLAITSSFPVAYLNYTYNAGELPIVAISLCSDSILNTCSLNRFYNDTKTNRPYYFSRRKAKNIERARWQFIHELDVASRMLYNLPSNEIQEYLQVSQGTNIDAKHLLQRLLLLAKPHLDIENQHPIAYHGLPVYTVKGLSLIFPCAWSVFGIINSYLSFGQLFDNEVLRWLIASTSTFPYLFLEFSLSFAVFSALYEVVIGCVYGTNHQSMGQQFYPKTFYTMTGLGLFTTGSAFGARAQFVTDKIPGGMGIALAVTVCISTVSYKSAAMLDMVKLVLEKFGLKFGDNELKELCKLVNDIRQFKNIIKDADSQVLVRFFHALENHRLTGMLSAGLYDEAPPLAVQPQRLRSWSCAIL